MTQEHFGVVALLSSLLLAGPGSVLAAGDPAAAECSPGTLRGTYLFAFSGLTVSDGAPSPYAVAGYEVYDGAGRMRSVVTNNLSGKIESNVRQKDAYAVKSDCIGTVEYADGTRYDLFIAPDGSRFVVVQTNPGKIAAGSSRGAPHSW